jgi:hypothetical protein
MLAVSSYSPDYIRSSLKLVDAQVAAYRKLAKAAAGPELEAFGQGYFQSMVLALDHLFLHRLRNAEGKDGGPCNEVRMLCDGIKDNGGVFAKNNTIKYDPAKSITGLKFGDKIALEEKTFSKLAKAFVEDVAARYP